MDKLEAHEKRTKKPWHRFAMTCKGRMSWADWFHIRHHRSHR